MSSKLDKSLDDIISEEKAEKKTTKKPKGKGKGKGEKKEKAKSEPYSAPKKEKGGKGGKKGDKKGGGKGGKKDDSWKDNSWKDNSWGKWSDNKSWGSGGKGGGKGGGKKSVLVTNVPPQLNWKDLKGAFSAAGQIEFCQVNENGRAEITFATSAAARSAVETYNGGDLNGRSIKVVLV